MNEREGPLVKAFVELADTLVADYDVIELAQRLVDDCVRLLAVDAAGILLAAPGGGLQVLASTTEQARLLELFQVQSEAGPCLLAYRSGGGVLVEDLTVEPERWPAFARRAIADGFGAVCALPLRLREERIGALNLFSATAGALSAQDVLVGQALADIATIGILHQRAATRSETINQQLQTALNTRIIIEQAKGMLAERGRLDMDHAFLRLRTYARANNLRLTELARASCRAPPRSGPCSANPLPDPSNRPARQPAPAACPDEYFAEPGTRRSGRVDLPQRDERQQKISVTCGGWSRST